MDSLIQQANSLLHLHCRSVSIVIIIINVLRIYVILSVFVLQGFGLLMTEDNSSYEGEFAGSPHLYGKVGLSRILL